MWIFSCQQTASVACSQHVSEIVYAAHVTLLFSAKMTEHLEQGYCMKFCHKLGDSQMETIPKIQRVFGNNAMGITQIKEWYIQFKDGRMSVESNTCSGWHSTSRNDELIDQVRTLVMQDRRVAVRELEEEVGISAGSVHSIVTDDLALRRVSVKFVPKLIQTFLAKRNIPVVRQAPYSPDMAPCNYWLFPHLKMQLKGT
jgi:hypothetical protein